MKKLGILLLVLCIKSAFSVPTVDVAKAIERTTSIAKKAESFNELKTKYIDKYTVQIQAQVISQMRLTMVLLMRLFGIIKQGLIAQINI